MDLSEKVKAKRPCDTAVFSLSILHLLFKKGVNNNKNVVKSKNVLFHSKTILELLLSHLVNSVKNW